MLFSLMLFVSKVGFFFIVGGIYKYIISCHFLILVYKYTIDNIPNIIIALFGLISLTNPYFLLWQKPPFYISIIFLQFRKIAQFFLEFF